jgi:hypothetical protein
LQNRFQQNRRDLEQRRDGGREADRERQRQQKAQQKKGQWNQYWQDRNAPRVTYNSSVSGPRAQLRPHGTLKSVSLEILEGMLLILTGANLGDLDPSEVFPSLRSGTLLTLLGGLV